MIEHRWIAWMMAAALTGCGDNGDAGTDTGTTADTTTGATTAEPTSAPLTTSGPEPTSEPATTTTDPTTTASSDPSTSTGTDDTGTADTGTDDTGPPPVTAVPVFLAQGHYGRTTISCDDGKTWVQNHSEDDAVRCFEGDIDCDHNAFAARGIAWGEGVFVMTWGWGHPGTLVRSSDASAFDVVMTETPTYADVAFGNGRFVANNSTTKISDDLGVTWVDGGPLDINMNTRAIEFFPYGDGLFVVTGESGDNRAIVRSPDGLTWTPASQRPAECGHYVRGMAFGADTIVLASGEGGICTSKDGGDTWTATAVTDSFSSAPVWTGAEFYVYTGATLHHSADGLTWTNEVVTPDSVRIGPIARSPDGTMVAANDGWMVWYEKQQFYRSTDGKVWDVLPTDAYVGSHPINFISHGIVAPGAGCPAP